MEITTSDCILSLSPEFVPCINITQPDVSHYYVAPPALSFLFFLPCPPMGSIANRSDAHLSRVGPVVTCELIPRFQRQIDP